MYSTGCSFAFFKAFHVCLSLQHIHAYTVKCCICPVCANMLVKHQVSAQWQSSKHWYFSPPAKRNQSCDALGAASPCHSCENTCKWYFYLLAAFMPNSMAFKSFCQGQDLHHTLLAHGKTRSTILLLLQTLELHWPAKPHHLLHRCHAALQQKSW